MKERLDVLLVKRGLAVSREKAKAVIMAGKYLKIRKPRRIETGKSHDTFRCDPG